MNEEKAVSVKVEQLSTETAFILYLSYSMFTQPTVQSSE